MNNNLIVLEQVPIISEQLKLVSEEISKKTSEAINLECTEDNKNIVKKTRTELSKEFQELENKRKELKNEIIKPYNEFMEKVYEPLISDKFKKADGILKEKINNIELQQKEEMQKETKQYFQDYAESLKIDFLDFSMANINILLSKSIKSLKNECKEFIDGVKNDLDVINLQEYKDEILYEYKNCLSLNRSIQIVNDRKKQIELQKQREEEVQKVKELEKNNIEQIEEIIAPEIIDENLETETEKEKEYEMTFRVTATKEKLKQLKQFLIENNYKFE